METATSFTALIVVAPQAPLLKAILHAAEPSAAHPPEPIGTWPLGQLDWQFRAVSVSLIFDSIESDLSMTKTRLKAPAHLGCKGGDGGVGGGEGEGGGGEGEGGGGNGAPPRGKMVSRIVQASQVAADVMRTGTNVLPGGWTLMQWGGGRLKKEDALRKKRAGMTRELESTGCRFDPRRAWFSVPNLNRGQDTRLVFCWFQLWYERG